MRIVLSAFLALTLSGVAQAEAIDPDTTQLPWVNGPARDSVYKVWESYNSVHIWEAFTISCPWCHRNAPQVADLKAFYDEAATEDETYERVQVLDLCLNSSARDCRSWVSDHEPDYPVVHDQTRYVWGNLSQANSIPQTFVTDCAGNLVGYTIGYWDSSDINSIKGWVEEALETECEAPDDDEPDTPDDDEPVEE